MNLSDMVYRPFAEADDTQQADFINGLARELLAACKWSTSNEEGQLCYVAAKLDNHGERFVTQLAEFVKLKKENS